MKVRSKSEKSVNDRYGHATGDHVLRRVASALQASARGMDLVARVGGEEFAFVLPNTNDLGAWQFAERVRQRVSELSIGAVEGGCTISLGAASSSSADLSDLLGRADEALYRAKANGRNRVEAWPLRAVLRQSA